MYYNSKTRIPIGNITFVEGDNIVFKESPKNTFTISTKSIGTVTSVSVADSNGIFGTVENSTTTPILRFSLGDISPANISASGNISAANLSGTNTGDITLVPGSNITIVESPIKTFTISSTGGGSLPVDATGYLYNDGAGNLSWATPAGAGTVTNVSVVSANGISGSVATPTTTPAITLTLGDITPTSVNGVTISGTSTPTLSVSGTTSVSGSNTGDQDLSAFEAKAIETSGSAISFVTPLIYNPVTAGTGNITADYTNARAGVVQKIYHNDSSVPTVPAGWTLIGAGSYVTGVLNIIYATWVSGTTVEYWIVQ